MSQADDQGPAQAVADSPQEARGRGFGLGRGPLGVATLDDGLEVNLGQGAEAEQDLFGVDPRVGDLAVEPAEGGFEGLVPHALEQAPDLGVLVADARQDDRGREVAEPSIAGLEGLTRGALLGLEGQESLGFVDLLGGLEKGPRQGSLAHRGEAEHGLSYRGTQELEGGQGGLAADPLGVGLARLLARDRAQVPEVLEGQLLLEGRRWVDDAAQAAEGARARAGLRAGFEALAHGLGQDLHDLAQGLVEGFAAGAAQVRALASFEDRGHRAGPDLGQLQASPLSELVVVAEEILDGQHGRTRGLALGCGELAGPEQEPQTHDATQRRTAAAKAGSRGELAR